MVGSADPEPGRPGLAHPEPRIHGSEPWLWAFVFFPEEIGDGGRRGAPLAALSVRQAAWDLHGAGARAVLPVLEGDDHGAVYGLEYGGGRRVRGEAAPTGPAGDEGPAEIAKGGSARVDIDDRGPRRL